MANRSQTFKNIRETAYEASDASEPNPYFKLSCVVFEFEMSEMSGMDCDVCYVVPEDMTYGIEEDFCYASVKDFVTENPEFKTAKFRIARDELNTLLRKGKKIYMTMENRCYLYPFNIEGATKLVDAETRAIKGSESALKQARKGDDTRRLNWIYNDHMPSAYEKFGRTLRNCSKYL